MINLCINDLSFSHETNLYDENDANLINDFIKDFLSLFEELKTTFSIERLLIPNDFRTNIIYKGFSIDAILQSINTDSTLKLRLKSFIANETKQEEDNSSDSSIQCIRIDNQESFLLVGAYRHKIPTISFRNNSIFSETSFQAINVLLYSEGNERENEITIKNISCIDHIEFHRDLLYNLSIDNLNEKWDAEKEPFRMKSQINNFLIEYDYDNKIRSADNNEKEAIYYEFNKEIAIMNGWTYHPYLSKKNSTQNTKRVIFKANNPIRTAYLSIDFRHGTFELLNRDGKHIAEYNHKGEFLNSPDLSGSHNIIIK